MGPSGHKGAEDPAPRGLAGLDRVASTQEQAGDQKAGEDEEQEDAEAAPVERSLNQGALQEKM